MTERKANVTVKSVAYEPVKVGGAMEYIPYIETPKGARIYVQKETRDKNGVIFGLNFNYESVAQCFIEYLQKQIKDNAVVGLIVDVKDVAGQKKYFLKQITDGRISVSQFKEFRQQFYAEKKKDPTDMDKQMLITFQGLIRGVTTADAPIPEDEIVKIYNKTKNNLRDYLDEISKYKIYYQANIIKSLWLPILENTFRGLYGDLFNQSKVFPEIIKTINNTLGIIDVGRGAGMQADAQQPQVVEEDILNELEENEELMEEVFNEPEIKEETTDKKQSKQPDIDSWDGLGI